MPGSRASASSPPSSSSTYSSSSSKHSSQVTSGPEGPKSLAISSVWRGSVVMSGSDGSRLEGDTGIGQGRPELASSIVKCLVERPARGVQPLGEHVDRNAAECERTEDLALVRSQRGAHCGA